MAFTELTSGENNGRCAHATQIGNGERIVDSLPTYGSEISSHQTPTRARHTTPTDLKKKRRPRDFPSLFLPPAPHAHPSHCFLFCRRSQLHTLPTPFRSPVCSHPRRRGPPRPKRRRSERSYRASEPPARARHTRSGITVDSHCRRRLIVNTSVSRRSSVRAAPRYGRWRRQPESVEVPVVRSTDTGTTVQGMAIAAFAVRPVADNCCRRCRRHSHYARSPTAVTPAAIIFGFKGVPRAPTPREWALQREVSSRTSAVSITGGRVRSGLASGICRGNRRSC